MSARPDISIIIVNWRSTALLQTCLASLVANQGTLDYEIVVIDNASFDGCDRMLATHFPSVQFVQSHENLGFGKANNRAVRHSHSDLLLFLNPDTAVIGDAVNRLVASCRRLPDCGAVGGTLLNGDGSIQTSALLAFPTLLNQLLDCNLLRRLWPRSRLWANAALFADLAEPVEIEAVSGACLMMRREAFEAIGGFSSEYFMYSEDTDICFKAHRRGYRNYFVPEARVVHFGDGSVRSARSSFAVAMAVESLWRFMIKHRGRVYARLYRALLLLSAFTRLGVLWILRLLPTRRSLNRGSVNSVPKWNTILRWSLGFEPWVLKY
jgi:GT2 family glycosyltransferase